MLELTCDFCGQKITEMHDGFDYTTFHTEIIQHGEFRSGNRISYLLKKDACFKCWNKMSTEFAKCSLKA